VRLAFDVPPTVAAARDVQERLRDRVVDAGRLVRLLSFPAYDTAIGTEIGRLAYWLVWLVGLIAALQPLGLSGVLTPVTSLTNEVFAFLPRLLGAGLFFFAGLILARIVRHVVPPEHAHQRARRTVLSAAGRRADDDFDFCMGSPRWCGHVRCASGKLPV